MAGGAWKLGEDAAQAVVLVRAVEESDRQGRLLAHDDRRAATVEARAKGERGWIARRAAILQAELDRRLGFLPRLRRFTRLGRGLAVPAVIAAFVLGLATNALGPERQVHVLAFPLLGLIVWNLAVLALLLVRRYLPVFGGLRDAPLLALGLEAWSRRLAERLARRLPEDGELVGRALSRWLGRWLPTVAPLLAARVRLLLHLGALTLVAGVVAGMYLRGVVFEYRATWESTFLDGATVDRIVAFVLGPAAEVLRLALPSAEAIHSEPGSAAPWIHLWAVTAAIWVGLPRTLLAVVEALSAARLRLRLEVEVPEVYERRLLAAASTSVHRVEVVPYSYHPPAAVADTLRARLHDVFGARAEIRLRAPVDYGTEAASLDLAGGRARVVLLSLAQTPEVEVHGELLRVLREDLPDGQVLVALVDASAFAARQAPGEAGDKRRAERRRAWDRVASGAGLEAVHLDLRRDDADDVVSAIVAGAWPPDALG